MVALNPHEELAWTMEFSNQRFGAGLGAFHVDLFWYGATRPDDGLGQMKLTGAADSKFTIERLNEQCALAR